MGYFGCGTRSNKIGWSLFAIFIVAGVVFMGVFVQQFYSCYDDYDRCITDLLVQQKITIAEYKRFHRSRGQTYFDDPDIGETGNKYIDYCEEEELEECDERVLALFSAMLISFIFSTVPLFVMFCCSHPPPLRSGNFVIAQLPLSAVASGMIQKVAQDRSKVPKEMAQELTVEKNSFQENQKNV
eukprot:TRINITY_DN1618_c0_g2_i1.p2 TRINITY_DN1618_c0_g2~~TRINITY_DN1618_c0_g2_i1.p2  ORF type:complete len:184 (+),score=20.13 TRINITY_DN1618_c0_g2_i1:297-848(+)